jgi:hypothetical protein
MFTGKWEKHQDLQNTWEKGYMADFLAHKRCDGSGLDSTHSEQGPLTASRK